MNRQGTQHQPVTAVIADDEPLAREGIQALLADDEDISVLQVCAGGQSAIRAIIDHCPDLVFLDVQMPGVNGFDVIRAVGVDKMPVVIFTTAFDQYAVDAFEANALEYLLKPFSDERFREALSRAKRLLRERRYADIGARLAALLPPGAIPPEQKKADRVVVRATGRTYFIPVVDIDWIEGADYYANVHAGGKQHLVRETLASLALRLDDRQFMRVHRSAIVNVGRVRELKSTPRREWFAILGDGTRVRLARGARARLETLLDSRAATARE